MKKKLPIKWIISGLCALLFLVLALSLGSMKSLDHSIYQAIYGTMASPFATAFFQTATALGGPIVLVALCFAVVLLIPQKEYRIPIMINLGVSMLLNLGVKNMVMRVRPAVETVIVAETGFSFPSGHTMGAACFYGFLIFLLYRSQVRPALRTLWISLLSLVIALVAFSRVYLGAHFFSDVLGGLLLSVPVLVVNTSLVKRYLTHPEAELKKETHPESMRFFSSFRFAFDGIVHGLRTERNMVIHFAAMLLVVVFGMVFGLTTTEWMVCLLLFGLVLAAELLNTALEIVVDMVMPNYDQRAKAAKDTAAGAVLVVSIVAAIVGIMIFAPKLLAVLSSGMRYHG